MASSTTSTLYITSARFARGYVEAWVSSETDTTATIYWRILCQQKQAALYGQEANGYVDGSYVGYCSGHIDSSSSSWKDVCSKSGYTTVNKTTAARSVPVKISTRVTPIDGYGSVTTGWESATCYVTVGAKTSYAVKYNANGGSGAPDNQTKWHGTSLTLSSTKPSRTGYTFQGWGTSASDTSVDYAAGASYTANAAITLYAIWKANTYTISFDANGGSNAPSSVTKTYGVALTLPTTVPTRTNYNFLGWSTSSTAATATYAAGGSFTTNAATTLYAVWELAYVPPIVSSLTVNRCDSDGTLNDFGTCAVVSFSWELCQLIGDNLTATAVIDWGDGSESVSLSGESGSVSQVVGGDALSVESAYTFTVTVTDSLDGSSSAAKTLSAAEFTIDFLAGGKGAAFGKPASQEDTVESAWDFFVERSSGDTGYLAKRADTDVEVLFGVGSGGKNHGVYSRVLGEWLIHSDGTDIFIGGKTLLDAIYPVGSVYIAYNSTSPASRFGGTWTAMTGVFPYFNAGTATGGSNTHTLTTAQMPSHTHGWKGFVGGGAMSGSTNYFALFGSDSAQSYINNGKGPQSAGSGSSHNNMPAYQTLYAWRRTA